MPEDVIKVISQGTNTNAGASANSGGVAGAANPGNRGTTPSNPIMDLLVERLSQQAKGISTSASSELQSVVEDAISSTQKAGELGSQRLQSERERELSFARDRAASTYTNSLENRSGYSTQVVALRELTETTEKSIRDLDKRYQEAILANDAATQSQLATLKMQKLQFLQEQEQNFYSNLFSVANLQQSAIGQMMQSEQFWAGKEQEQQQFVMQMAQSQYQFSQNNALQIKELGLRQQELDIARERNQISRAEYQLKANELAKEKNNAFLTELITRRMIDDRKRGIDVDSKDLIQYQAELISELGPTMPGLAEMSPDAVAGVFLSAKTAAMNETVESIATTAANAGTGNGIPSIVDAFKLGRNASSNILAGSWEFLLDKDVQGFGFGN